MIFDSILGNVIGILVGLLTIIIFYFKWSHQYWHRKKLPYLEPSIPFGNTTNPFQRKENAGNRIKRYYTIMKSNGWKHGGLYSMTTPSYMPLDLDYIKNILTKDFEYFTDRGMYYNEKSDPLTGHLFNIAGPKWRHLRVKLTPTFTSGKMRMMFQTLLDCVPNFLGKIEKDRLAGNPIDIKETLGCFTTDIIGSCAFGLDCNSFEEDDSPFRKYGRKFFSLHTLGILKLIFAMNFPKIAKFMNVKTMPQDISEFFIKVVKDTVEHREKTKVNRKDFIQLLIDMKNNDGDLTIEELAAQCFVFFIAGFETSSTTSTFALYELGKHPEIQEKLRKEIRNVLAKHDNQISYESIQEMKYMDQVINEALRKYPPLPILNRRCIKDYKIPGETVVIEQGTRVLIPVIGIHYDPEYYPDPEKFDPERFNEENKSQRHNYAHLPFGEGPRNCIGLRFGVMQTKVGLAALLKDYRITVNKKTIQPLKFKPTAFIPTVEGEMWLDAEKL